MLKKRNLRVLLTTLIFLTLPLMAYAEEMSEAEKLARANADQYGILTLLPPLLAIILAFITKNVVFSLFIGALSGTYLLSLVNENFVNAIVGSFIKFTDVALANMQDGWKAGIILQVLAIGGLIALVGKLGGAKAVAETLSKKAKTARSAQVITWFIGLLVFFDDYANSLIAGPIMRPVTDKMRVSREKLAFLVDATAAPIAGIVIISTWVGYELSLIKEAFTGVGMLNDTPFQIFISTIPYRFYNILMLIFVLFTAITLKEFGPMYKAERRARKTGKVLDSDARPMVADSAEFEPKEGTKLSIWNAIIPIGTLIVFSFGGFYFNGLQGLGWEYPTNMSNIEALGHIFGKADASIVIFQAALFAGIVAIAMGVLRKQFTLKEAIDTWVDGLKSLLITGVILLLAWSLSTTIDNLGTRFFLTSNLEGFPKFIAPSVIFVLGSVISFATGTSYGTMGILMPLAIPFAIAVGGDYQFAIVCCSAVLTGAILGDHCSPISDTTILSSMGAACDHLDHVKTQLPYSIFVGFISIAFGYLPVGLGLPIYAVLPVSIVLLCLVSYMIGKKVEVE